MILRPPRSTRTDTLFPYTPLFRSSIRDGRFKFNHCELDPPQLFDLVADPLERHNLAADPAQADRVAGFMAQVRARWDMQRFDAEVRRSQARRWVVYDALRQRSDARRVGKEGVGRCRSRWSPSQ